MRAAAPSHRGLVVSLPVHAEPPILRRTSSRVPAPSCHRLPRPRSGAACAACPVPAYATQRLRCGSACAAVPPLCRRLCTCTLSSCACVSTLLLHPRQRCPRLLLLPPGVRTLRQPPSAAAASRLSLALAHAARAPPLRLARAGPRPRHLYSARVLRPAPAAACACACARLAAPRAEPRALAPTSRWRRSALPALPQLALKPPPASHDACARRLVPPARAACVWSCLLPRAAPAPAVAQATLGRALLGASAARLYRVEEEKGRERKRSRERKGKRPVIRKKKAPG
jgi:hypothetical protein